MLLEVILSVLIIASGLSFIIRSYSTSLKATNIAKSLQRACLFLEEKLFELDMKGNIEEGQTSGVFEGGENYSWYLTAEPLDEKEEINKVGLSVVYGSGRQSRRVSVSTYLRNKKG